MKKLVTYEFDGKEIQTVHGVKATYELHTHNFFEFFLVTKGRAVHVVNDVPHIVERGTLALIRPDDYHCYDYYQSDDFEFKNRGFSPKTLYAVGAIYGGRLNELISSPLPKHVKIEEDSLRFLEQSIENYNKLTSADEKKTLLNMLISVVLCLALNTNEETKTNRPPKWFTDLLEKMNENENYIDGLPRLISLCGYSQEYINRAFKRFLNTTPTKYINELRLKRAVVLLKETDNSILDIAESCGFNNLSHFYSEFKRIYGISPNKVR